MYFSNLHPFPHIYCFCQFTLLETIPNLSTYFQLCFKYVSAFYCSSDDFIHHYAQVEFQLHIQAQKPSMFWSVPISSLSRLILCPFKFSSFSICCRPSLLPIILAALSFSCPILQVLQDPSQVFFIKLQIGLRTLSPKHHDSLRILLFDYLVLELSWYLYCFIFPIML